MCRPDAAGRHDKVELGHQQPTGFNTNYLVRDDPLIYLNVDRGDVRTSLPHHQLSLGYVSVRSHVRSKTLRECASLCPESCRSESHL